MLLTDEVKDFARKNGADLVGVSSTERFKGAPKGHKPSDLLPKAKSVIVVAKHIPISVVRRIPSPVYSAFCSYLNRQLHVLTYEIALFIEDRGFEALPLAPTAFDYALEMREKLNPQTKKLKSFSHRYAAVMTGLGEISAASYVVVPKFGPRVIFASVISTAQFNPDPNSEAGLKWGRICKPEKCGLACVKTCPSGALAGDGTINHSKCQSYRASKNEACGLCLKACPIGVSL